MIAKKNSKLNLEKNRFAYVQIGLLVTGGLLLTAFTWRKPVTYSETIEKVKDRSEIPLEKIARQELPKEEPAEEVYTPPSAAITLQIIDPNLKTKKNTNKNTSTSVGVTVKGPNIKIGDVGKLKIGPAPELEEVVKYPGKEATFVGGVTKLKEYLSNHTEYPEMALQADVQGKVFVQFVVEKDGRITNVEVINKVDKDLDREARRVVRSFPKWIPGEVDGEKCRTRVVQPINFRIK